MKRVERSGSDVKDEAPRRLMLGSTAGTGEASMVEDGVEPVLDASSPVDDGVAASFPSAGDALMLLSFFRFLFVAPAAAGGAGRSSFGRFPPKPFCGEGERDRERGDADGCAPANAKLRPADGGNGMVDANPFAFAAVVVGSSVCK
jgi:hypothetical protein